MERVRYSKNMAEGSVVEQENTTKGKISRRGLLGAAAAGVGLAAAASVERHTGVLSKTAGIFGKAIEGLLNRTTQQQINAAQELERRDLPRFSYKVKDNPEIRQMGGLAVRKEPAVPLRNEGVNQMYLLQPGEEISDAISWTGRNPLAPGKPETNTWIVFKDSKGRVGFVANLDKYLESIQQSSNP